MSEEVARRRAVRDLDDLAFRGEEDAVLADDGAAADGVHADLALRPLAHESLATEDEALGILPAEALGDPLRERDRRAARRVLLLPVVSLHDLDVVIGAERLRDLGR